MNTQEKYRRHQEVRKEGRKEIMKWKLTKAEWSQYTQDLNTEMEANMKKRPINAWEKDIRGKILKKARKYIGEKKVKRTSTKLTGW